MSQFTTSRPVERLREETRDEHERTERAVERRFFASGKVGRAGCQAARCVPGRLSSTGAAARPRGSPVSALLPSRSSVGGRSVPGEGRGPGPLRR